MKLQRWTWTLVLGGALAAGCSGDQQAEEPVEAEDQQEEEDGELADVGDLSTPEDMEAADVMAEEGDDTGAPVEDAGVEEAVAEATETSEADAAAAEMVDSGGDTSSGSADGGWMWVRVDHANVRSGPGVGFSKVAGRHMGQKVQIWSKSNGWVRIGEGQFMSIVTLANVDPYYLNKRRVRYVRAPDLNVRSAPQFESAIVGRLTRGEMVAVRKFMGNGWVKIGEGQYVNGNYLTRSRNRAMGNLAH